MRETSLMSSVRCVWILVDSWMQKYLAKLTKMYFLLISTLIICVYSAPLQEGRTFGFLFGSDVSEFGHHFEGDMILTSEQKRAIFEAQDSRNGLRGGAKRWPNKTVVYYIKEGDFDEEQIKMIENGMAEISNKSCVLFRPRSGEEHAVTIQGLENGCYSNVGVSIPGEDDEEEEHQVLNLAKGCFKHGTVVHEMLHTIGFYHMQSTYDRDDFVKIVWENISPGKEHNFAKYNNDTVTDFGVEYDYGSVMHYPEKAFSKNGNRTIIPLKEEATIGQREGLSEADILKLNRMYCEENQSEFFRD